MRAFRRLPPLLRALGLLGLLAILASVAVFAWSAVHAYASQAHHEALGGRGVDVALMLEMIGLACNLPVGAYRMRLRRATRSAPWLDSWRGQLAVVAVLAAPPISALAVALLVPYSSPLFGLAFLLGGLSALLVAAAYIWLLVSFSG